MAFVIVLLVFVFATLDVTIGNRKAAGFGNKRLLDNDQDVILKLLRDMENKILSLNATVNQLQKNSMNKAAIGFHAELTHDLRNLPHDYIVVFDKIVTNDGEAYDTSNGIFTSPMDGLNSFSWTTLTDPGHAFHTVFTVDGTVLTQIHDNAANMKDGKTATKHGVVHLQKGSKAWIKTYQLYGQVVRAVWSSFSGFKI